MDRTSELLALRERPLDEPNMLQNWLDLTFLHWAVEPTVIQEKISAELQVDTFEGKAYLSMVPFTMTGIRHLKLPPIPGFSAFHEWNLRSYVVGPDGPGVWFIRLDAANLAAVRTARTFFKLPYWHSTMSLTRGEADRSYRCTPKSGIADDEPWVINTRLEPEVRLAEPGSLEFWLVERYLLYSYAKGRLYSGQVHHSPYRIQTAQVATYPLGLLAAEGFSNLGDPIPEMQFSEGVSVELFPLKRVGT